MKSETIGKTTMDKSKGLKSTPSPNPRAQAVNPPFNPRKNTLVRCRPTKTKFITTRLMFS